MGESVLCCVIIILHFSSLTVEFAKRKHHYRHEMTTEI